MSTTTEGVWCLDKPYGWASFDVVARVKKFFPGQKVGHAGTLDPLATGVLIVCVGRATKQIAAIQEQTKAYTAQVYLGATTASYDAEQPPLSGCSAGHITTAHIQAILPSFTGLILQVPPAYSAIKQSGQPVYSAVRKGQEVTLQPRSVQVYELELTSLIAMPEQGMLAELRVVCSKGTYIRSLAADMGARLGVGGFLAGLTRTAVGNYVLKDAWSLPRLAEHLGMPPPLPPRQLIGPNVQTLKLLP